jgi:hypothetical protein
MTRIIQGVLDILQYMIYHRVFLWSALHVMNRSSTPHACKPMTTAKIDHLICLFSISAPWMMYELRVEVTSTQTGPDDHLAVNVS